MTARPRTAAHISMLNESPQRESLAFFGERLRRQDPERQAALRQRQQCPVAGDQAVGARRRRELEEFLVVGVAALRQVPDRKQRLVWFPAQFRTSFQAVLHVHAALAQRVAQGARQLGFTFPVDYDLGAPRGHGGPDRRHRGIVEHQPVDPDLGIQHQTHRSPMANTAPCSPVSLIARLLCKRSSVPDFCSEDSRHNSAMSEREATVLFADVSGSTKLYETAGDAIALEAISGCIAAARRATEGSGGRVVKTIGDEVMGLFPGPDSAANAAAEIQAKVELLPEVAGTKLG